MLLAAIMALAVLSEPDEAHRSLCTALSQGTPRAPNTIGSIAPLAIIRGEADPEHHIAMDFHPIASRPNELIARLTMDIFNDGDARLLIIHRYSSELASTDRVFIVSSELETLEHDNLLDALYSVLSERYLTSTPRPGIDRIVPERADTMPGYTRFQPIQIQGRNWLHYRSQSNMKVIEHGLIEFGGQREHPAPLYRIARCGTSATSHSWLQIRDETRDDDLWE